MKPRVYVETSIVSYLTSRKSRNALLAGQQQATRLWWRSAQTEFELVTSQLVVDEASAGDPAAARKRLQSLEALPLLEMTLNAKVLAEQLIHLRALPTRAADDAMHLAIAAVHRADFLLTWNCRHLANARIRRRIEEVCRSVGHQAPILCTPYELFSED